MMFVKKNWHRAAMTLILMLAGFLSFYRIEQNGLGNEYYSVAVKSMLSSWHNFFFASFDPGGFVTVDKPALGLWLQVISTKIFGFYGWSLILPEALSTVISVALIYHIVQRTFGKTAGVLSALILAVTPILIAVSRTNNLDASLVMVLLFATWAMIAAGEKGSFKLLILSVILVGLGFNIKMLQAYMILPAIYLVYFFTAITSWRKKIIHLSSATIILLIVSLSWAVIVDLTPADKRPYIGSSQTNSVIELALGYNGIERITGTQGKKSVPNNNAVPPDLINDNGADNSVVPPNSINDNGTDNNAVLPNQINNYNEIPDGFSDRARGINNGGSLPGGNNKGGQMGNMGGPGGIGENGEKGIFRIFNNQLSGQISWLLPMALFGILSSLLSIKRIKKNQVRLLILWLAWLAPMLVYFSIAGFFHRYYLSMLSPAIAALSGIGLVSMWKAYLQSGWKWIILPISILVTATLQIKILCIYSKYGAVLIPIICVLSLTSIISLIAIRLFGKDNLRKTVKGSITAAVIALLIAPAVWAYTPIIYGSQTALPYAGPELNVESNSIKMPSNIYGFHNAKQLEDTMTSKLIEFLLDHYQGEKYLVAVANAGAAEPIILETGKPVMATGGFSGSDPILTVDELKEMVEDGEVRYFMASGRSGQSDIMNWVKENGEAVSLDGTGTEVQNSIKNQNNFGVPNGDFNNGGVLYDLTPDKN